MHLQAFITPLHPPDATPASFPQEISKETEVSKKLGAEARYRLQLCEEEASSWSA